MNDADLIQQHIAAKGVTVLPARAPKGAPGVSRWNPSAAQWLAQNDPNHERDMKAKARRARKARAKARRNPRRVAAIKAALHLGT